jgi:hypothetical protein
MKKQRYYCLAVCLSIIAVLGFNARAQENKLKPELTVAGVILGNRPSAKTFLTGYSPRQTEDKRVAYFFYNKYGTQVMKLVAASAEDPFYITEIEVFAVGRSYQTQHNVQEKIGFFETESKIFIGYQQSVASMIIGLPGVTRNDQIGPKDVIKKKGAPTEQTKTGDDETIIYNLPGIDLPDEKDLSKTVRYDYEARYEFSKNKLKKFNLKISAPKTGDEKPGAL